MHVNTQSINSTRGTASILHVNTMYINSTRDTSSVLNEDVPLTEFIYLVLACIPDESYLNEDVPLTEFIYLVFTCVPGERYCRQLGSLLLCLCYVFRVLINSLVLILCKHSGPRSVWDSVLAEFGGKCQKVRLGVWMVMLACHIQWPGPNFRVTAVLNSFGGKFHVLKLCIMWIRSYNLYI